MKKIVVLLALFVATTSFAWTVSWDPLTTYTDNTTINDDNVVYDVWKSTTPIATGTVGTSATFSATKGEVVTLKARARLTRQGTVSDNSVYGWTSPLGTPGNLLNLRVAP